MKFCSNCHFMLYPVEDPIEKKLKFRCKHCYEETNIEEETESQYTVFNNEIKLSTVRKKIDPAIVNDPTYSRTKAKNCPECNHGESIFFHDFTQESSGMKLIFVCCNEDCGHSWENKNEEE